MADPISDALRRGQFGDYDAVEQLGSGGTGIVLRAVHRDTGELAAIKLPKGAHPKLRDALFREAAVLRRLNQAKVRGVVHVIDTGVNDGIPWYAMEYLEGPSLHLFSSRIWESQPGGPVRVQSARPVDFTQTAALTQSLSEPPESVDGRPGPPSTTAPLGSVYPAGAGQLERVLRVLLRIGEVLAALHREGVTHGDLTPSNIILRDETDPTLIDFGAALMEVEAGVRRELPLLGGAGLGTPGYLAPERIQGSPLDSRCDLYAFGAIAYELLTGKRAFIGAHATDILRQHLRYIPIAPQATTDCPPTISDLVIGLLAVDPLSRVSRAEDVCRRLRIQLGDSEPAAAAGRTTTLFRPELHERDDALGQIKASIDQLCLGNGGLMFIVGDAGVGKTRLLNHVASHMIESSQELIWCGEAAASYAGLRGKNLAALSPVITGALDRWRSLDPSSEKAELEEHLRRLALLTPLILGELLRADAGEEDTESVVQRGLAALLKILELVSASQGLVLLIDDLQWTDELTVRFLKQLSTNPRKQRVLVITTVRPEVVPGGLQQLTAASAITLRPLGSAAVGGMTREMLGATSLPEGLLPFLMERTDGIPWHVSEYLQVLITRGALTRKLSGQWSFTMTGAAGTPLGELPRSVEGLIRARFEKLSLNAQGALSLAAILGRDFDRNLVLALGQEQGLSLESLEELVAKGLLSVSAAGRYQFTSDAVRQAHLSTLDDTTKARAHAHIADYLETQSLNEADPGALGMHWAAAGEPRKAVGPLERGARLAVDAHALARASDLLSLCIEQYQITKDSEYLDKVAVLRERLAEILITRALHQRAREVLSSIEDDAPLLPALTRARIQRKLAASYWTQHDYEAAAEHLQRAFEALEQVEKRGESYWVEFIQIKLGRFEQLYFSGKTGDELDAVVEELADLMELHGSNEQKCVYYQTAASHALLKNRYAFDARALELASKGVEAAALLPEHRRALASFIYGFCLLVGSRQAMESVPWFERAFEYAEQGFGSATLVSRIRTYMAIAFLRCGDTENANLAARSAHAAADSAQMPPYVAAAEAVQGWVAWRHDDRPAARRLLGSARRKWAEHPHSFPFSSLPLFPLLEDALFQQRLELVEPILNDLQNGLPKLPAALQAAVDQALSSAKQGTAQQLAEQVNRVVQLARHFALS